MSSIATIEALERQPGACWADIECALVEWVACVLGINQRQVIWANQKIAQPDYPYVSLFISSGPLKIGGVDEVRNYEDTSAEAVAANEQLVSVNMSPIQFTLQVSVFVDQDQCTDPGALGVPLATILQASLGQRTTRDNLETTGSLAVVGEEGITDISQEVNGRWISAATFDVLLRTTHYLVERITFIEQVQVTSPGPPSSDITFDETIPESTP